MEQRAGEGRVSERGRKGIRGETHGAGFAKGAVLAVLRGRRRVKVAEFWGKVEDGGAGGFRALDVASICGRSYLKLGIAG